MVRFLSMTLTLSLLGGNGCADRLGAPSEGDSAPAAEVEPAGPRLDNPEWTIVEMATAHSAFVIEVKAVDPLDALEIARLLTEPLIDRYVEILVYVRPRDSSLGLSSRRVQWTLDDGYVVTSLDAP